MILSACTAWQTPLTGTVFRPASLTLAKTRDQLSTSTRSLAWCNKQSHLPLLQGKLRKQPSGTSRRPLKTWSISRAWQMRNMRIEFVKPVRRLDWEQVQPHLALRPSERLLPTMLGSQKKEGTSIALPRPTSPSSQQCSSLDPAYLEMACRVQAERRPLHHFPFQNPSGCELQAVMLHLLEPRPSRLRYLYRTVPEYAGTASRLLFLKLGRTQD